MLFIALMGVGLANQNGNITRLRELLAKHNASSVPPRKRVKVLADEDNYWMGQPFNELSLEDQWKACQELGSFFQLQVCGHFLGTYTLDFKDESDLVEGSCPSCPLGINWEDVDMILRFDGRGNIIEKPVSVGLLAEADPATCGGFMGVNLEVEGHPNGKLYAHIWCWEGMAIATLVPTELDPGRAWLIVVSVVTCAVLFIIVMVLSIWRAEKSSHNDIENWQRIADDREEEFRELMDTLTHYECGPREHPEKDAAVVVHLWDDKSKDLGVFKFRPSKVTQQKFKDYAATVLGISDYNPAKNSILIYIDDSTEPGVRKYRLLRADAKLNSVFKQSAMVSWTKKLTKKSNESKHRYFKACLRLIPNVPEDNMAFMSYFPESYYNLPMHIFQDQNTDRYSVAAVYLDESSQPVAVTRFPSALSVRQFKEFAASSLDIEYSPQHNSIMVQKTFEYNNRPYGIDPYIKLRLWFIQGVPEPDAEETE